MLSKLNGKQIGSGKDFDFLVGLVGLRQSSMSFPNGSNYAAVAMGHKETSGDSISKEVEEDGKKYRITFYPRTEKHVVDFGPHYASGGGAFVEGGYFEVRELHPTPWITEENPRRLPPIHRPLGDGETVPPGFRLETVYM